MEHVSTALARGMAKARRPKLAPLEPDAFLHWAWKTSNPAPRSTSITVADVWFEWVRGDPDLQLETVRKHFVRMAARVRRQQRLGMEPWGFVLPWRGQ